MAFYGNVRGLGNVSFEGRNRVLGNSNFNREVKVVMSQLLVRIIMFTEHKSWEVLPVCHFRFNKYF